MATQQPRESGADEPAQARASDATDKLKDDASTSKRGRDSGVLSIESMDFDTFTESDLLEAMMEAKREDQARDASAAQRSKSVPPAPPTRIKTQALPGLQRTTLPSAAAAADAQSRGPAPGEWADVTTQVTQPRPSVAPESPAHGSTRTKSERSTTSARAAVEKDDRARAVMQARAGSNAASPRPIADDRKHGVPSTPVARTATTERAIVVINQRVRGFVNAMRGHGAVAPPLAERMRARAARPAPPPTRHSPPSATSGQQARPAEASAQHARRPEPPPSPTERRAHRHAQPPAAHRHAQPPAAQRHAQPPAAHRHAQPPAGGRQAPGSERHAPRPQPERHASSEASNYFTREWERAQLRRRKEHALRRRESSAWSYLAVAVLSAAMTCSVWFVAPDAISGRLVASARREPPAASQPAVAQPLAAALAAPPPSADPAPVQPTAATRTGRSTAAREPKASTTRARPTISEPQSTPAVAAVSSNGAQPQLPAAQVTRAEIAPSFAEPAHTLDAGTRDSFAAPLRADQAERRLGSLPFGREAVSAEPRAFAEPQVTGFAPARPPFPPYTRPGTFQPSASTTWRAGAALNGTGSSAAYASLEVSSLSVHGSVPTAVVRRAIERIRPELVACYRKQYLPEARLPTARFELLVDEVGRVRSSHVRTSVAELDHCLAHAAGNLVVAAPDTGTLRLAWIFGGAR